MSNIVDQSMAMNAMTDQEMAHRKLQIDALRKQFGDSQTKDEKLRQACEGFESIFIQKMWEQMRSSVPKEGYLHSREEEMYQSMFDQEFSKKMASAGGIGLGDMLYEQLSMKLNDAGRTTTPSTLQDRLPMEPVRMSHMQPKAQVDYAPKLAEAEGVLKAVAEASIPRTLNTDLYSPLDESLEAVAAVPVENPEESLVQAALSDFASVAVVNTAQAELAQANINQGLHGAGERDAMAAQQPKQPFAIGRVPSPRNSAEGARASISPHDRIDQGNISNTEAKEESRILNRAKSVAAKTQKSAKNAQTKDHANYISSPLPAVVPQSAAALQPVTPEMSVNPAAMQAAAYPGQPYSAQPYSAPVPAAYAAGAQGMSPPIDQNAALGAAATQGFEALAGGIHPAVGSTILPPEVRASQQQAAQAAAQAQVAGQDLSGSQASGKVVGSFNIPVSAMSPDQAQVAKVEVPAGSRPIVEAPARDAAGRVNGFGEQPLRKQNLNEEGAVPAAYGRTGIGAAVEIPKGVSQNGSQAVPSGRQTSQMNLNQMAPNQPINLAASGQIPFNNFPGMTPSEGTPAASASANTGNTSGNAMQKVVGNLLAGMQNAGQGQASQWPVSGKVSSPFGWQNNADGQKTWNPGVEIAGAEDASVRAFMDGEVAFAGEHEDYGNLVVLEHAAGLKSYYGNAKAQGLQPGDQVKVGTEIAKLSMTAPNGQAAKPADSAHLRFETRRGELPLNPESLIAGLF